MTTNTDYSKQIEILNDLWINHTDDEVFEDFIQANDLGLPLAHLILTGVVESTPRAKDFIEQSFADLLELVDVEDTGFESLAKLLKAA